MKPTALLTLVACGVRIESCGLRDMNPRSQPTPGIFYSLLKGLSIPICLTKSYARQRTSIIVKANNALSII